MYVTVGTARIAAARLYRSVAFPSYLPGVCRQWSMLRKPAVRRTGAIVSRLSPANCVPVAGVFAGQYAPPHLASTSAKFASLVRLPFKCGDIRSVVLRAVTRLQSILRNDLSTRCPKIRKPRLRCWRYNGCLEYSLATRGRGAQTGDDDEEHSLLTLAAAVKSAENNGSARRKSGRPFFTCM